MLKYIGNIVVNDPTAGKYRYEPPRFPKVTGTRKDGLKQILDARGPEAVKQWVLDQKKAAYYRYHYAGRTPVPSCHQSENTRYGKRRGGDCRDTGRCFSLEMWGGATFDVAYRFLKESPWEPP